MNLNIFSKRFSFCLNCSKKYFAKKRQSLNKKFCSTKCSGLYYAETTKRVGPANHMWKGGRYFKSENGYVYLTISQLSSEDKQLANAMAQKGNESRILEHRLVMARKIGRPLISDDIVHHVDCNKSNNNPENLELLMHDNRTARNPIICPECKHKF